MFGWFKWKSKRNIFSFWDGERQACADPLQVWMSLKNHPQLVFDKHFPAAKGEELDKKFEAKTIIADAARTAFGVSALAKDGRSGLTDLELCDLVDDYFDYLDALKKNGSP